MHQSRRYKLTIVTRIYWHLIDDNNNSNQMSKLPRGTGCPCELYWTLYQWFYCRSNIRGCYGMISFLSCFFIITIFYSDNTNNNHNEKKRINREELTRPESVISELENQMITYHSRLPLDQPCLPVCMVDTIPHSRAQMRKQMSGINPIFYWKMIFDPCPVPINSSSNTWYACNHLKPRFWLD